MAENSAQERTEAATPKKKQDTRKKGQVPRSKELNTFTSLIAAGVGMLMFGQQIITDIAQQIVNGLSFGRDAAFSDTVIFSRLGEATRDSLWMLLPLLLLMTVVTVASPLSLGGFTISGNQIAPKLERISIIKGLGRMFSPKSLMELVKALGKFLLVSATACAVLYSVVDDIILLPMMPLSEAYSQTGSLFIWCLMGFSSVLVVVALMDVPFQIWEFNKQIRMTKQEIKDEMKETEGNPELKGEIKNRQQEMARQRMMSEVPTADVVITNPTHYAVALKYNQFGSGAPRVVAKGRDLVAARIRELASENRVAIFSAPPLARALYASTDLNQEIPGNLFVAVAQVLAYIFQLRNVRGRPGMRPARPRDLPVPDEYDEMLKSRGKR